MTVLIAILSIWAHELGHALACVFTGDPLGCRRWSWKPFVNLDPLLSIVVPVVTSLLSGGAMAYGIGRPFLLARYDVRVLLAGPMVNAAIFAVAALFNQWHIAAINLGLALVNLLPIPPLDGWAIYKQVSLRVIANRRLKKMIEKSPST